MGSGKSHACSIFAKYGIPVYDSDSRVKNLLNTNEYLKKETCHQFGDEAYTPEGKWNRDYIVKIASENPAVVDQTTEIIDPYLLTDFRAFKREHSEFPIVAIESAILYKSKIIMDEVDKLVLVTAPFPIQMERIQTRDPFRTEREIKLLLSKQVMPPFCQVDFILVNDGIDDVEKQIRNILNKITPIFLNSTNESISASYKNEQFGLSVASADKIGENQWYISRVMVIEKHRGRGIGSLLLNKIITEIKTKESIGEIVVFPGGYDTNPEEQMNFYIKNGFVKGEKEGSLKYVLNK